MPVDEPTLARIAAESAIHDALARYARGADRNDVELLRSAYHPDATDSHGYFSGTIDGFVDWFTDRHANVTQSMHFLGNCLIELDGDAALFVETYCQAFQRLRDPAVPGVLQDLHVLCRYVDRFERRAGVWAIATRTVVYETQDVREVSDADPFPPGFAVQVHGAADPSYSLRLRPAV